MSEKENCTNLTDDDGVKMEKDKEAKKESQKTESEYDKETIGGPGKKEKTADDGQLPNEENRRSRLIFGSFGQHRQLELWQGRWDPSLDPQVLQAGLRCGGQRTQTS